MLFLQLTISSSHICVVVVVTYLAVLDLVVIFVLGTRGVLANVLSLGQLSNKDLGLIVTLSLSEGELGRS